MKSISIKPFIEHGGKFFETVDVMERVKECLEANHKGIGDEGIAEQIDLPKAVVKAGLAALEKTGQIHILDPKKNPLETLAFIGTLGSTKPEGQTQKKGRGK